MAAEKGMKTANKAPVYDSFTNCGVPRSLKFCVTAEFNFQPQQPLVSGFPARRSLTLQPSATFSRSSPWCATASRTARASRALHSWMATAWSCLARSPRPKGRRRPLAVVRRSERAKRPFRHVKTQATRDEKTNNTLQPCFDIITTILF